MKKPEQLSLIMSIVERGSGGKLVKLYQKNQVFAHVRFEGLGTATSEILDILGLGGSEKDIILSMATRPPPRRSWSGWTTSCGGRPPAGALPFPYP